ncbi:MAG: Hsp20/alpha crystallin family protein [Euryarchaeota archaeon]|nr:Hsp20/alpha crystallin family protein [Euryarchaeota archaeon]
MIRKKRVEDRDDWDYDIETFEDEFEHITRYMERAMHEMMSRPAGEWSGPFVYGVSMRVGPDGRPVIQRFGNTRPAFDESNARATPDARGLSGDQDEPEKTDIRQGGDGERQHFTGEREPLTDVILEDGCVAITVEIPGVEKSDIDLEVTENRLRISVDSAERRYFKEIDLPAPVDADSAKATYNNGVLDIMLSRRGKREREARKVRIE